MTRIAVVGGGVCGLAAGLLLAGDGHDVTVLERDPSPAPPVPADAWDLWMRRGVAQFRQIHYLLPRVRHLLEAELPAVADALGTVALRHQPLADVTAEHRDDDADLVALTARRPVAEAAVAAVAERTPGLTVRRGTGVRGVRTGPAALPGVPHVTGVVTDAGEELPADLVVDASGRRRRFHGGSTASGPVPAMRTAKTAGSCISAATSATRPGRCQRRSDLCCSTSGRCRFSPCPPTTAPGAWV